MYICNKCHKTYTEEELPEPFKAWDGTDDHSIVIKYICPCGGEIELEELNKLKKIDGLTFYKHEATKENKDADFAIGNKHDQEKQTNG